MHRYLNINSIWFDYIWFDWSAQPSSKISAVKWRSDVTSLTFPLPLHYIHMCHVWFSSAPLVSFFNDLQKTTRYGPCHIQTEHWERLRLLRCAVIACHSRQMNQDRSDWSLDYNCRATVDSPCKELAHIKQSFITSKT